MERISKILEEARENGSSQDRNSSEIFTENTCPDVAKRPSENALITASDSIEHFVASEQPPAVSIDPLFNDQESSQRKCISSNYARPFASLRQKSEVNKANAVNGSAMISGEMPHGMAPAATWHLGNDLLQNTFSAGETFGQGQTLNGLSNLGDQIPFGQDQFWKDHEEISRLQSNPVDSAYDTASVSRETGHGVTSATTTQLDSNTSYPNPGSTVQRGPVNMIPVPNPLMDQNPATRDDAEDSDSDGEYEEADVSNQISFETYEENDPLIVQDLLQKQWGRTGTRNGREVWFNPKTSKWRK